VGTDFREESGRYQGAEVIFVLVAAIALIALEGIGASPGAGPDPFAGSKNDPFTGTSTGPQPDATGVSSIGFGITLYRTQAVLRPITTKQLGSGTRPTSPGVAEVTAVGNNPNDLSSLQVSMAQQGSIDVPGGTLYPANPDGSPNVAWLKALPNPWEGAKTAHDIYEMDMPTADYQRREPCVWIPGREHPNDQARTYPDDLNPAWMVYSFVIPQLVGLKIDPKAFQADIPGWVPATLGAIGKLAISTAAGAL
jgi:hypothetical protein